MDNYTPTLPPETWLLIIEILEFDDQSGHEISTSERDNRITKSTETIRNLCFVSRFFLQLANPFRFQEIHVRISIDKPPSRKTSYIQGFLDLIERQPEIKGWIKTFEMGGLPPNEFWREQNQTVREQYMATLPRIQGLVPELKNLHTLRCQFSAFTPSLYFGILQLTNLRVLDLTLENLDTKAVNMDHLLDIPVKPSICPVHKINLSGEIANSGATASAILAFIQLGTLTELKYWARTWPPPPSGITLFKAINEWIPDHVFVRLQCLEVVMPRSGAEAQHFMHLGKRCPNLMDLRIHRNFIELTSSLALWFKDQDFTGHHFPSLQHFSGPLALAPVFADGRPVQSVTTSMPPFGIGPDDPTITADAVAAMRPSVPIRVLSITTWNWNDGDIEAVSQHHPQVENFAYSCMASVSARWSERHKSAFKRMTRLKRLAMKCPAKPYPPDTNEVLDEEHPIIAQLRGFCPNLELVFISWLGSWERSS